MTYSVPGVLVSRNGEVREYIGNSNRGGTLFGTVKRLERGWVLQCECCNYCNGAKFQRDVVILLRDHWRAAADFAPGTHEWRERHG